MAVKTFAELTREGYALGMTPAEAVTYAEAELVAHEYAAEVELEPVDGRLTRAHVMAIWGELREGTVPGDCVEPWSVARSALIDLAFRLERHAQREQAELVELVDARTVRGSGRADDVFVRVSRAELEAVCADGEIPSTLAEKLDAVRNGVTR